MSEAAKYYIDMLKSIHAIKVEDGEVPDMKETALAWADFVAPHLSEEQGKKLRRLPPPLDSFKTIVTKKIVSVGSKIESIVTSLKSKRKRKLYDIYREAKSRSDLIAAFLAVLELAKNKTIYVSGDGDDIQIELLEGMESVD